MGTDESGTGSASNGGPLGGLQCVAPQAEVASVRVADTTSNGMDGSRVSSTGGIRVSNDATGAWGWSKAGRSTGIGGPGGGVGAASGRGGAAGSAKWSGRSAGAYSGPSSQVAILSA